MVKQLCRSFLQIEKGTYEKKILHVSLIFTFMNLQKQNEGNAMKLKQTNEKAKEPKRKT